MAGERKEAARAECRKRGIRYNDRDTIKTLEEKCDEYDLARGRAPQARARVKTHTRSSSARNTVSPSRGGGSRSRSAPLAKSAPTTRMRVDDYHYEQRPPRGPTSADILAVALVVFMCVLAACSSQFDKSRGGPNSYVPAPIVSLA